MVIEILGGWDDKPPERKNRSPEEILLELFDTNSDTYHYHSYHLNDERIDALEKSSDIRIRTRLGEEYLSRNAYKLFRDLPEGINRYTLISALNLSLMSRSPAEHKGVIKDPQSILTETIKKINPQRKLKFSEEMNLRSYMDTTRLKEMLEKHYALTSGQLTSYLLSLHQLDKIKKKNFHRWSNTYRFSSTVFNERQDIEPSALNFYGRQNKEGDTTHAAYSTLYTIGCRFLFDPNTTVRGYGYDIWCIPKIPFLIQEEIKRLKIKKTKNTDKDLHHLAEQIKRNPEEMGHIMHHMKSIWGKNVLTDARVGAIVSLFYTDTKLSFEERVETVFGDTSMETCQKVKALLEMHEHNPTASCLFLLTHELRHHFVHHSPADIGKLAGIIYQGREEFLSLLETTPELLFVAVQKNEFLANDMGTEAWLKENEKDITELRFGPKAIIEREKLMANVRTLYEVSQTLFRRFWSAELVHEAEDILEAAGKNVSPEPEFPVSYHSRCIARI